uniref:Uncharacterized protein n=1 Tax=Opuntia streptacantha TaxID=393608 RepID=A0A7C8ZV19_OPUST
MATERIHLFWEILLAIILPPLGVCLRYGCCSVKFWICFVLTLLGYIPGIIYAIYVIVAIRDHHLPVEPAEGHYVPVYPGHGQVAVESHYVPVGQVHGHAHSHGHGHGH